MTQKHLFQLLPLAAGIQLAVLHGAHSRFIRLFSPRTDHAARCEITIVPPNNWLTIAIPLDEAAPSLQPHYRAFLTTTSDSAPVLRLGTQGLAGAACLTGSLHIGATGSHVPYGSQDHGHAPSMPDAGIIGHPQPCPRRGTRSWFRRRQKMFRHVIRGSLTLVSVILT